MNDLIENFRTFAAEKNIPLPLDIVPNGKIQRFNIDGHKAGSQNGAYQLHIDGAPNGWVQDFTQGEAKHKWKGNVPRSTNGQRREFTTITKEKYQKDNQSKADRYAEAAKKARFIENQCIVATEHAYLERKQTKPHDALINPKTGDLVIPFYDENQEITTLQFIKPDGSKRFFTDGRKKGCFHFFGAPTETILLCEGWATGASLFEATGQLVIVAGDAGNLGYVATIFREKMPKVRIIVCGDNDSNKSGTGERAAIQAALSVGGKYLIPPTSGQDWNDVLSGGGTINLADAVEPMADNPPTERIQFIEPSITQWPDMSERPCYRAYDDWPEVGGKKHRPGLYWHSVRNIKAGDQVPVDTFVCPPLHVDAGSSDSSDHNYGLLLRFKNRNGRWIKWLMPCEMVGGNSEDINRYLQHRGLPVDNLALLKKFFNQVRPERRLECALKTGWHDASTFVLPERVIGNREDLFFQTDHDVLAEYGTKGDLNTWRGSLGRICIGNPLLIFQVGVSFAGALLKKTNMPYVGFHIFGETSTGKSTGQKIATSVWGSPSFGKTWNSTGNGLEALAVMYNDGLLALDELGNSRAKDVDNIVYLVANGKGKNRAKIKGTARKAQEWRVALLSNGETTLAQHLKKEGLTAKGGQSVRFLEIPVFGKYGALNELHGFENGATFSVEVQKLTESCYGTAGMAYLEKLTKDSRDFHQMLNAMAEDLKISDMCNQEVRAIRAFALVAVAGEVATEYGLTGWNRGMATEVIKMCIARWRTQKGVGNTEDTAILDAVRSYVDKYGELRFTKRAPTSLLDRATPTGERSGWFDYDGDKTTWLFHEAGLREAAKGFDIGQVKNALLKSGWLIPDSTGKSTQVFRVDGGRLRLYAVKIPSDEPPNQECLA